MGFCIPIIILFHAFVSKTQVYFLSDVICNKKAGNYVCNDVLLLEKNNWNYTEISSYFNCLSALCVCGNEPQARIADKTGHIRVIAFIITCFPFHLTTILRICVYTIKRLS